MELITVSEEGLSAEEDVAPSTALRRGICFRRVALVAFDFAVFVLFALRLRPDSKLGSPLMVATPDVRVLIESSAVKALGRPLTEQEHKMFREDFTGAMAHMRNLADAPISPSSASLDCQKGFSGQILKANDWVATMARKVAVYCLHPDSDACHAAHEEAASLEQTMKNECVQGPSTDICQQSGDNIDTVDVCIPKTCQNDDDLDKLALGDTAITCGGGGLEGVVNHILNSIPLPELR